MNCEKRSISFQFSSINKKKKQKHRNKPKQQSTMKKKKKQQQNENHKSKSIDDTLPLELIHRILLRVPLIHLARLKCVSKLWHSLISDPDFAESHRRLSAAPTHVCLLINDYSKACSVDIDAIFHGYKHAAVKEAIRIRRMSNRRGMSNKERELGANDWTSETLDSVVNKV
ncbi:F-box/kelch-repeat protein At3g06240-like isoform X2 [Arachis ipaensis]|uniref:F-box/kelch-repeat protein At3g06240-like isoform X2 n=1 Tax=Arachis ipaensis TaxID=130454 RepID=UPI000A2AF85D|nr:F-box/kelch-repeat protein At3g06240-like isoform X2 [Arachis ipaensis]